MISAARAGYKAARWRGEHRGERLSTSQRTKLIHPVTWLTYLVAVEASCLARGNSAVTNVYSRFQRVGILLTLVFVTADFGECFVLENTSCLERSKDPLGKLSEIGLVIAVAPYAGATFKGHFVKGTISLVQQIRSRKSQGKQIDQHVTENNDRVVFFIGFVDSLNIREMGVSNLVM